MRPEGPKEERSDLIFFFVKLSVFPLAFLDESHSSLFFARHHLLLISKAVDYSSKIGGYFEE